jgi:hypothetical protein
MMGYLDETNDLIPADMRVKDLVNMYHKEQNPVAGVLIESENYQVRDPISFECFDRILKTLDEEEKF